MGELAALGSAAVFGGADFLGGLASRKSQAIAVTFLTGLSGLPALALLFLFVSGEFSGGALAWGIAAGVLGGIGLMLFFSSMAKGTFQVVAPLAATTSACVPVAAAFAIGEQPENLALAGLAVALVAIWLLTAGQHHEQSAVGPGVAFSALAAGLGFGAFYVLLDQSPEDSGVFPLLGTRIGSLSVVGLLVLATGSRLTGGRTPIALAVASGTLDMTANALFLAAARLGNLAVVGVLASLYPVSNAALAAVVLRERTTGRQRVGFALALIAVAFLTL